MKNYSAQLGKFIVSTPFANGYYRRNDSRTWASYYEDEKGMVHSNTANYTVIKGNDPVTKEEFYRMAAEDKGSSITFS